MATPRLAKTVLSAVLLAILGMVTPFLRGTLLTALGMIGIATGAYLAFEALRRRHFLLFSVSVCLIFPLFVSVAITPDRLSTTSLFLQDYTPGRAALSIGIQLLFLSVLFGVAGSSGRFGQTVFSRNEGRLSSGLALLAAFLGIIGLSITAQGVPLYAAPYGSVAQGTPLLGSGGAKSLSVVMAIAGTLVAYRRFAYNKLTYRVLLIVVSFSLVWFQLLRGERSLVLGALLLLTAGLFSVDDLSYVKRFVALIVVTLTLLTFQLWGTIRVQAAEVGLLVSTSVALQNVTSSVNSSANPAVGAAASLPLFKHMYGHLLSSQALVEAGSGLRGKSITDLPAQLPPRFLSDERPPSGPVRLSQYRSHAGGLYVIAESYWNGGLFATLLFALLLGLAVRVMELGVAVYPDAAAVMYAASIVVAPDSLFFGMQAMVRNFQVVLLAGIGFIVVISAVRGRLGQKVLRSRALK